MSRFKKAAGSFFNGLGELAAAMADGDALSRIRDIEEEIAELSQERDHLIATMHEPGNRVVSEDYDPEWRKTVPNDGRLTQCKGAMTADDPFRDVHPGCPYKGSAHRKH